MWQSLFSAPTLFNLTWIEQMRLVTPVFRKKTAAKKDSDDTQDFKLDFDI